MRPCLAVPFLCAAALACAGGGNTVRKQVVSPPGATPIAPYSPAIRAGDLLFMSGVVGTRRGTRELVPGGIAAETAQALENIRSVLNAAGLTPADVVKCTAFLVDMREFDALNAVYGRFFTEVPPARSAIGVAALPLGARVEIECIALYSRP